MKVVRFKRSWSNYFAGDVAGFEDAKADRLVAEGFAEPYVDPAEVSETPETPEDPETPEEPVEPETPEEPDPAEPAASPSAIGEDDTFPGYLLVKWQAKNGKWYPDKIDGVSEADVRAAIERKMTPGKRIRTGNGMYVTPQVYEIISQDEYAEASE